MLVLSFKKFDSSPYGMLDHLNNTIFHLITPVTSFPATQLFFIIIFSNKSAPFNLFLLAL